MKILVFVAHHQNLEFLTLKFITVYNGNFLLPEDGIMLRNVVNNKVVLFLSLCGRCYSKSIFENEAYRKFDIETIKI